MREAIEYIPWVNNITSFRQLIIEDIEKNEGKEYNVVVLQRKEYKRYYIKGENIIKLLEKRYE